MLERAVLADRDLVVGRQQAGHAGRPEHLLADVAADHLVDFRQLLQAAGNVPVDARDQFDLGFAEVGGDVRMGQGRAEAGGMRVPSQRPVGQGAKALLLQPPLQAA